MLHSIVFVVVILCAEESLALSPYLDVYPNVTEAVQRDDTSPLYFGLMLSLSGDQQSTGALAGVQAALDDINNRDDLLPGYSLHYTLTDSKCNRTTALDGLFTQLFEPPRGKVALIGSGCSIATEATAEISHYYNVTQISCASSSGELTNRVRFPNYFQLLPSEVHLARVFYSIIKEYGWRRVAMIVQNELRFKTTVRALMEMSDSAVNYSESNFYDTDDLEKLLKMDSPLSSEYRVYLLAMNVASVRLVICEAHRLGLRYPKYVFLTYGSYDFRWWDQRGDDANCTAEERAEVLQFSLAVLHFHVSSNNSLFYASCYDATWTLVNALNASLAQSSGNHYHVELLKTKFENINFPGISGPVNFNKDRVRDLYELSVLQYRTAHVNGTPFSGQEGLQNISGQLNRELRLVEVAYMRKENGSLEFLVGEGDSIWPEGYIPRDGVPGEATVTVALPLTIVSSLLNISGIVGAMICLFFNVIFRKRRLIRLDSPNLNYVIVVGGIVIYVGCIVLVLPNSSLPSLCIVRAWLIAIGYSLGFGTLIAKLWRIFIIFRGPRTAKRMGGIKDWHLISIVASFILVDIFILSMYTALEGILTHFSAGRTPNEEKLSKVDEVSEIETILLVSTCSTNPRIRQILVGILHAYKGFLQLCALFFAYRTRKVKVEGLNNTKYITALVYSTSVITAITAISLLTLMKYINVYAVIYSLGFWLANSLLLGLLFIPKMVSLYKDPDGDTVFTAHNRTLAIHTIQDATSEHTDKLGTESDVETLKEKIKHLENLLTKQDKPV